MSKQCLDVHQMQHLQELGLEMKETMLYWARCVDNNPRAATHYGKWVLIKGNNAQTVGLMHWEFIPAYTLQDVLDALPEKQHITFKSNNEDVTELCDLALSKNTVWYECDKKRSRKMVLFG